MRTMINFVPGEMRIVRDAAGTAKLVGYAAVFNSDSRPLGKHGGRDVIERILPGAFADELRSGVEARATILHDQNVILGRRSKGTLSLHEDAKGLRAEITLPDTQLGRDTAAQVERGDLDRMSFGFGDMEAQIAQRGDVYVRTISKVKGFQEVTLADNRAAYPGTSIELRMLDQAIAESRALPEISSIPETVMAPAYMRTAPAAAAAVNRQQIKAMMQQRATSIDAAREILKRAETASRPMSAEESTEFDRLHQEAEGFLRTIEGAQRQAAAEAHLNQLAPDSRQSGREDILAPHIRTRREELNSPEEMNEGDRLMLRAYVRGGVQGFTAQQRDAYEQRRAEMEQIPEMRALSTTVGASGQYSVPDAAMAQIETKMKSYSGVLQACKIVPTDDGRPWPYPTGDDTGNTGEQLDENTAADDNNVDPVFGQVNFGAYLLSSRIVKVPMSFLNDSNVDVESWLFDRLAERVGRLFNNLATLGNGSSTLQGIVTGASAGFTSWPAASISYADLVSLIHVLDASYRDQPMTGFMFSDQAQAVVEKLTDSSNRPILLSALDSVAKGLPKGQLLGYPAYINVDMSSPAQGAKSVLFGDFSKFIIRRAGTPWLLRLDQLYANKFQVGFLLGIRYDTKVIQSGAIKTLTQGAS